MTACLLCTTGAGAINISSVVLSEASSLVILNNSNHSNNISILFPWCWFILLSVGFATSIVCLLDSLKSCNIPVAWLLYALLLQDEPDNTLPNVIIFKLGLGCNLGKDLSRERKDDQLVKCKDTG